MQLGARVIEHERHDELLDEAERVEIAERADVVERQLLFGLRNVSGSTRANDSGMNGFEKSSRLSSPIKSSTRQWMRSDAASVAWYV